MVRIISCGLLHAPPPHLSAWRTDEFEHGCDLLPRSKHVEDLSQPLMALHAAMLTRPCVLPAQGGGAVDPVAGDAHRNGRVPQDNDDERIIKAPRTRGAIRKNHGASFHRSVTTFLPYFAARIKRSRTAIPSPCSGGNGPKIISTPCLSSQRRPSKTRCAMVCQSVQEP